MKIPVGVSNRHIHLKEEIYRQLFDEEMTKRNDLNQPGEFAANQVLIIKTDKNQIDNVRILGPFRDYNQVEISKTDAYLLGLTPPVRKSGDLIDCESITLVSPKGEVRLDSAVIIAERHVHMTKEIALENNFIDNQKIYIKVSGEKPGIIEAKVKTSEEAFLELHLDTDDANAFLLKNGDEVEIIK